MPPTQHCVYADCPTENDLVAMLEGQLSPEEVVVLEAAIDRCPACQELLIALAHAFGPEDDWSEEPHPSEAPTHQQIQQYHIIRTLGAGGMGVVYEAFDNQLQRNVALKLLRPDVFQEEVRELHASRLVQEARLLARLVHPHIPTVYEVGIWNEQVFMAVQMINGSSLKEWLQLEQPSWDQVVEVYLQVGKGLVAAHTQNIVHRDIKPDNILVDHTGHAYITDFGLARRRSTGSSVLVPADKRLPQIQMTQTGMVVGTPAYMSPEQRQGQVPLPPSDQYSFCVSLYESLCGIVPFSGAPFLSVGIGNEGQSSLHIPKHSGIPKAVFAVLERGLQRLPIERFGSMEELLEALEQARRPRSKSIVLQVPTSYPLWSGLVTGAGLLVLLVGGVSFYQSVRSKNKAVAPRPNPQRDPNRRLPQARAKQRRVLPVAQVPARRVELRKVVPRPGRWGWDAAAYAQGTGLLKQALSHHRPKECLKALTAIEQATPVSRKYAGMRSLMKLYRGQCLLLSGQCQEGAGLIRAYQRQAVSRDKESNDKVVATNVDLYCPLTQGAWRVVLRRFVARSQPLLDAGAVEACRKVAMVVEKVSQEHKASLASSSGLREDVSRSLGRVVGCLSKKGRLYCALMQHYWMYAASLYQGKALSKRASKRLEKEFLKQYALCRP